VLAHLSDSDAELVAVWHSARLSAIRLNSTFVFLSLPLIGNDPSLLQLQFVQSDQVTLQYRVNVAVELSPNAYLGSLWLSDGVLSPPFSYSIFNYQLLLTNHQQDTDLIASSLLVMLQPENNGATMQVALRSARASDASRLLNASTTQLVQLNGTATILLTLPTFLNYSFEVHVIAADRDTSLDYTVDVRVVQAGPALIHQTQV
jgi:hypothetical protein